MNVAMLVITQDALILHPDKRVMMMIPPGVASSAGSASHGVGGGKIPEDHTLTLKREDAFRRLREALEAFCASSANRSSAAASMYTVVSPPGHPSASATARTAGLGVPGDRGGFDPTRHSWGAGGGGGGPDLLGGGGGWAGGGRWSSYMDEEAENIVPLTMAPRGINRDGWAAASSAAVRSHPPEDPTRKKRRSFADCTVFQRNWGSGVGGGGNGGTVCREGDAADAPPASSRMGPPPSVWAAAPPSSRPTLAMRDGSGGRGHKAREGGPCPRRPAGKAAKPEGRARRAKANALTGRGGDALSNAVGVGSERPADRHTTTAASVSGITEDDNVADDVIVCVSTDGTNEVESDTAGSSSGISSDGISISQEDEGAVGACSSLHNDGSSGPAATRSGPGVCEESWSGDGIGKGPPPHGGGTATAVTRGWGRPRAAPVFTLGGPSSAPSTALLAPPLGENKAFPISRMHASRLSPPDYPPNERPEEAAATSVKLKPCSHPRAEQGGGLCVSPLGRMAAASSGANLPTVDPSDPDLDLVPQDCGGIPGAWWSSGDGIAMEEEDPSAPAGSGPPGQKKAAALPDGKRRVAVTRVTIESLEQHYEALHDEEVPSLRAAQSDGGVLLASGNAGRRRVKAKVRLAVELFMSEVRVGLCRMK